MSRSSIFLEAQFNDFILDSLSSRTAPGHKNWLRSMMCVDHHILFTHADIHPRNVMVTNQPDSGVELSGIIGRESSGFFFEYWEQLKAFNTCSIKAASDWWEYLPSSFLGYDQEVVLDRVNYSVLVPVLVFHCDRMYV